MTNTIRKEDGWLITIIKRQGMSFMLLAFAVYFLGKETRQTRMELLACEKEKVELLKAQNSSLEKVIIANTVAITSLNEYIQVTKAIKKPMVVTDPAFNSK